MEDLPGAFDLENMIDCVPRYNAAPGQDLPIIIKNRIGPARWGFVPDWAGDNDIKPQINARLETVQNKPMFAEAVHKRRCLVPASGFYEWAKSDSGKQPYYIHCTDDTPVAFAGIWSKIATDAGHQVTFAIVTKPALPEIAYIHARMPVMLDVKTGKDWLYGDPTTAHQAAERAAPPLTAYPVSTRVNKPAADDAGLIAAINT